MSPEQVLYASDYPYGQQPASMLIALRTARIAGLDEEQIRNMLHASADRIADGEPPLTPTAPQGADFLSQPLTLARIATFDRGLTIDSLTPQRGR